MSQSARRARTPARSVGLQRARGFVLDRRPVLVGLGEIAGDILRPLCEYVGVDVEIETAIDDFELGRIDVELFAQRRAHGAETTVSRGVLRWIGAELREVGGRSKVIGSTVVAGVEFFTAFTGLPWV